MSHRLDALLGKLMNHTVLADFFAPAEMALNKVRFRPACFHALPMDTFCLLNCLRHLQGMETSREHLQQLFHLADAEHLPVARSTYSDALGSASRLDILEQSVTQLVNIARAQLPDRLAAFAELGKRPIYAVDGSYQKESAHFPRHTPKQGGDDNPKGHLMLTYYDVRLGAPMGLCLETRNRHEMAVFKEYGQRSVSLLRQRQVLWVMDRAFVDMPFWDAQQQRYGQTCITRLKDNLVIAQRQRRTVSDRIVNEGVITDEDVTLKASSERWRLIHYRAPDGNELQFLTNERELEPGVVAFLYLRRWDEEKCFDTWKNDFSVGKAWTKSVTGILQQALFAIMTSLLLLLFTHRHQAQWGIGDEKSLKKQDARIVQQYVNKGKGIPWYRLYYRATSKISRQVIRFLKHCFTKKASPGLYERQLRPMLLAYL